MSFHKVTRFQGVAFHILRYPTKPLPETSTETDTRKILSNILNHKKIIKKTLLEEKADKDITIYVHGANSNFYRATAQGALFKIAVKRIVAESHEIFGLALHKGV